MARPGFADHGEPMMVRASGVRLWDTDGNEWLDGMAGMMNVSLGYGRPEVVAAVAQGLEELSFATLYYGRSHVRAVELSERLSRVTPKGINRFLYTNSGAEAVETALKISRYVNAVEGRPERHQVIGRMLGYHGLTYGGISASGMPEFWNSMGPLVPGFSHISQPTPDRLDAAEELEQRILELGPENVAAFIAEPVSLPSGIVVPPPDYWPRIREICTKYGVLMIADEIICGFARTSETMFALERYGVVPDLLLMSKSINNGAVPMGAVGISDGVDERLTATQRTLYHGFTGSGHPAACAAALATLDIYEREDILGQSRVAAEHFRAEAEAAAARANHIGAVRLFGMILGVDLVDVPGGTEKSPTIAAAVSRNLRRVHLLCRPSIDRAQLVFGPALNASTADLTEIVARIEQAATEIDV
jgi:adenosylmethionine-8-amino-7-oxononanoate aminotransferase